MSKHITIDIILNATLLLTLSILLHPRSIWASWVGNVPSRFSNKNAFFASSRESNDSYTSSSSSSKKDNKAMEFLRRIGKVGGNRDFTNAIGVDEGIAGKSPGSGSSMRKAAAAFKPCTKSGTIDDMSETFPYTSSGTQWSGHTDQAMGGVSFGSLIRGSVQGKKANVMSGRISSLKKGDEEEKGFVQMSTNLAVGSSVDSVDASEFDGIELDVLYRSGTNDKQVFYVALRTPACKAQSSSYRASFSLKKTEDAWETIRLPWHSFLGYGPGPSRTEFDSSLLKRVGIVLFSADDIEFNLAVSGVRFFKVI